MVDDVVPFVDAHLATVATPKGRVLAGLSAGGFGAVYIALRHPGVFGAVESWSGYFHPLRDGPFKHDTTAQLRANDPRARSVRDAPWDAVLPVDRPVPLALDPARRDADVRAVAAAAAGVQVRTLVYDRLKGEWRAQFDAGLTWALRRQ